MRFLVGLGNPGPRYVDTRHNLGFRVAEAFAGRHGIKRFRNDGQVLTATVRFGGEQILVAKPLTFMNDSGSAVRALVGGASLEEEDLVVAHDDLDLEQGVVRVKVGGGDGGQKGIRSIIAELGTGEFTRIRLGIQRPVRDQDAAEWVLEPVGPQEAPLMETMIERGADAAEAVFRVGSRQAMNQFNRRPRAGSKPEASPESEGGN